MFGNDFNHTLGNSLACRDEGIVGNARKDVWVKGGSLMCHGTLVMRQQRTRWEYVKSALNKARRCTMGALNEA